MKMNKKAFTLVEILFVVVIAIMVLGFSAHKLKNMKSRGVAYGATGFLVDLGNAKAAITADLAREGIDLDAKLRSPESGVTENIEVTTEGIEIDPDEAKGQTISQYLEENHYSKEALIKALAIFGYLKYGIDSVGEYRYYLYVNRPISNQCGSLPSNLTDHTITYMCGVAHRTVHEVTKDDTRCKVTEGAVFLDDGTISKSGNSRPAVVGVNRCQLESSGVPALFRCAPRFDDKTYNSYMETCPATASFYGSGVQSQYNTYKAPTYVDCINTDNPSANHNKPGCALTNSCCKTVCNYDTTEANNVASDNYGENTTITIVDPADETKTKTITCYDYWHHYGTISYK